MAFNFQRLKNWLGYENLVNTDLNSEFNNIISKAGADTLSSANSTNGSAPTVPAMQTTSSPGNVGSENLAATMQADIQQLRYQLNAIIGGAQWYSPPVASLATLNSSVNSLFSFPQSRVVSGRVSPNAAGTTASFNQPMFLSPNGAAATVNLLATSTNFIAYFNNSLQTFSANIALTGLSVAPAANNTCLVNDAALTGGQATRTQGERGTVITIDTIGANITALNGTFAAFKRSGEYFIALVDTTNNRLIKTFRGVGFDSSDVWLARTSLSDNDAITLMKLAWIFATYNATTPGLAVTYNKPTVAYATPTGPAIGDYWYDLTNSTWRVYNGTSFASTIAVFAGISIQDTTNCVAARSVDFFKAYSALNTVEIETNGTANVRATNLNQVASVYGTTFYLSQTEPNWNTAADMDTGLAIGASQTYYCYISDLGDLKISNVRPTERKFDLFGSYHPAKPWRSVGEFTTDAGSLVNNDSTANSLLHHEYTLPGGGVYVSQTGGANPVQLTSIGNGLASSGGADGLFYPNASTRAALSSTGASGLTTRNITDSTAYVMCVGPTDIPLRFFWARIPAAGTAQTVGNGFTYTHTNGTGIYVITFTVALYETPAIVTQRETAATVGVLSAISSSGFTVTYAADTDWSFIAVGRRANT